MHNKDTMFEEMGKAGSNLPDMVEALQKDGWKIKNHHDNWVHPDYIGEYDTHMAYTTMQIAKKEKPHTVNMKVAIETICEALRTDSEYRKGWRSNIAMSLYDQWHEEDIVAVNDQQLVKLFNDGAERFINLLTNQ